MHVRQEQQRQCKDGNDLKAMLATMPVQQIENKDTSGMMATTPVQQGGYQCKDASTTRVTTPAQ
jgi:hypothetical protein